MMMRITGGTIMIMTGIHNGGSGELKAAHKNTRSVTDIP